MCDLDVRLQQVTDTDIKEKLCEIRKMFEIVGADSADPRVQQPEEEELCWSAKVAAAQAKMVTDYRLDAMAYYYRRMKKRKGKS